MAFLNDSLAYALAGGMLPALIWLLFWLREDIHPEPKRLIVKAFFAGAMAIPAALVAEAVIYCGSAALFLFSSEAPFCGTSLPPLLGIGSSTVIVSFITIIGFAAAEEYAKYRGTKKFFIRGSDFDEPVDAMIYLIVVALGFAAFENVLFLIPAFGSSFSEGLMVGNLRFLGATLLHAISSGAVGYAIALSFYRPEKRKQFVAAGLVAATALHAIFNAIILHTSGSDGSGILPAVSILALTGMVLVFAFDRAKKIAPTYAKRQ